MPYVCVAPGCRGNYKNGPKVHTFKFPSDADLCRKWVEAIGRLNFQPTKHSKVCELHFPKEKIILSSTATDSRTGQTVTVNLKVPKLAPGSIPTLFPNCPKYLSENVKSPPSPPIDIKLEPMEEIIFTEPNINTEQVSELYQESVYDSYDGFLAILASFEVPLHWNKIVTAEKVLLLKLIEAPGPVLTYSIVINSALKVETFLYGREIPVSIKNSSDTKVKTPFSSNNINEIKDLLSEIDKCDGLDKSNPSEAGSNSHQTLNQALHLIESVSENNRSENPETNRVLPFIREQLKLLMLPKEKYRYSNFTLIVASILHTISPHAYDYLRRANIFILPHPRTIASVCSPLLTDPTSAENEISLKYASNVFRFLTEKDKHVILHFDEIHINPHNSPAAKSAFVFMLASVRSKFKEVAHIIPVTKVDHETIFSLVKTVIIKLELIGYKVFCVVSDNSAVNGKGMSMFATPNKLSIVYPHPVNRTRPLFYLFDSVRLLRCIKRDWLNTKPNQTLRYPDFESGDQRVADFGSLKDLRRLENSKLDDSLSVNDLYPTSQNVASPLKIFNSSVVQALSECDGKISNSKETAEFMNIVLTWWKIVSVKTPFKGKRLNDDDQEPITSHHDRKIIFLERMLDWLNYWGQSHFSSKLTSQTHAGLSHTIYGLMEITKYCFSELNMSYILLANFQIDELEHGFGKYRQLAGDHYHIFVRRLLESRRSLRIQSVLTLNSQIFGDIQVKYFCDAASESTEQEEEEEELFNPEIIIDEDELNNIRHDLPVITYLAGYCCYAALKTVRCDVCKRNLVCTEEMIVEDNYDLIKELSHGKLLLPQAFSVQAVYFSYMIFNKIISEFEEDFSLICNKRQFLIRFIFKYIKDNGYLYTFPECSDHKTEDVAKIILNSTSNILLQNYCSKTSNRSNVNGNQSSKLAMFNR